MSYQGSMIDRYLHARDRAAAAGDRGVVAECDANLRRLGYDASRPESAAVASDRADAEAQPVRGRPTTHRDA